MAEQAAAVTARGIAIRGMRLLVHRGQALLLLVVGALAGAAIAGATVGRDGPPAPVLATVADLIAPSRSALPAQIEIVGPRRSASPAAVDAAAGPQLASGMGEVQPATGEAPATTPPAGPLAVTTVVPGIVYTYPPDDHGGSSGSGRSGSGGGPGHGGGR